MLLAPRTEAQERRVVGTATTFHKDPNGTVLASLPAGPSHATGETRADWIGLTLDGWVPASSVTRSTRDGFDLVVSVRNGQELRREPDGPAIARLRYGALLERVSTRGSWVRVRRSGWVVGRALARDAGQAGRQGAAAGPQGDTATGRQGDSAAARPIPRATEPVTEGAGVVAAARTTGVLATPGGEQRGSLAGGAPVRVITRAGEWTRVQVEGWVRTDDLDEQAGDVLVGISAAELRADPERYVGKEVQWRVQFIALRTADELRPELPAGEPYLLARGPLPEAGFLYVLIPRAEVERFQTMEPLQTLRIRAIVRAPRTRHLPTPVVELRGFEVIEGS